MPNLIIIIFNHVYPVFYVRFYCKGCACERVWRLKILLKTKWISWEDLWEVILWSKPRVEHMTGMWRVMIADFCEWFAGKAKHSILLFCHMCSAISSPILFIPSLPTYCKECFQRENPRYFPWELEIVIPTIICTILCGFPLLLPLHIHILERSIAQTRTTPNLSVKWGFDAVEKYWKKPIVWQMQLGWIAWSEKLEKTRLC